MLHENREVMIYNKPGQPPLLFKHPDLHDHIRTPSNIYIGSKKAQKFIIALHKDFHKINKQTQHVTLKIARK
jgi:hypothetical protein